MKFETLKSVYFIGIGGIGMSALARYFHAAGKKVAGYDKTPTPLTAELEAEGIAIQYKDDVAPIQKLGWNIKDTLVVVTPAIPSQHSGLNYFKGNGFTIMKRSKVLGLITENCFTVAVAGTHGKTTTSSMIAHLLRSGGINCTAFLGGISKNYDSNLLLGDSAKDAIIVVEADEYDRSFLSLHPDMAVITSMDADHLDIYGDKNYMEDSYRIFAGQVKENGLLIAKSELPIGDIPARRESYSLNTPADYTATAIKISNHKFYFNWKSKGRTIDGLSSSMPGRHNVENFVAAIAVANRLAIPPEKIKAAISTYTGVKRRFDYQVNTPGLVYIDDYAHHPFELKACISSARELYPKEKITGIFQPHLYSRTRDFADGFAESLSLLDELILLDIYPARELPIEGVTSALIYDKVTIPNKTLCTKEQVVEILKGRKIEVLLTLGAGDIDQLVDPIRKLYSNPK